MTWPGISASGQVLTLNLGGGVGRIDWEELRGDVSGLIDSLIVIGLRGQPVSSAVPIFGDVLFYDGTKWVPSASGVTGSGVGLHNLLSITHQDTLPASPVGGDIISTSGSIWVRFPIGSQGQSLTVSSGGNPEWSGLGITKAEIITSGSVINLDSESRRIIIRTSASSTVNLPSSPIFGQEIIVKDGDGSAGPPTLNSISIVPQSGVTIDSLSSILIRTDYGAFSLLWNGIEWNII